MAEVFGVVAAVVGVVDVGSRVSARLRDITHTWKHAPAEILALSNEVTDITVVLHHTKDACNSTKAVSADSALAKDLDKYINTARSILTELNNILDQLASTRSLRKKVKWIQLKDVVLSKKNELKSTRTEIRELLRAHNV